MNETNAERTLREIGASPEQVERLKKIAYDAAAVMGKPPGDMYDCLVRGIERMRLSERTTVTTVPHKLVQGKIVCPDCGEDMLLRERITNWVKSAAEKHECQKCHTWITVAYETKAEKTTVECFGKEINTKD